MKTIAKTAYYSIAVDKTKNRIYLTIIGFWKSPEIVPAYVEDMKKACQEISPGFTVLADVTRMITPPAEVAAVHERAQQVTLAAGLRKTAEILPKEKALEKMALAKWSTASGMLKGMFHAIADAEAWLDETP